MGNAARQPYRLKYLSLFSGIGEFELGIKQAYDEWVIKKYGEPVFVLEPQCVGFSEIDKYAVQIYQKHFNHKNYEDITKIEPSTLPEFDFLVGGFPCQGFSIAGSRRGFDDTRGTLFFDIARIIEAKRPRYLLLENVGLLSHDRGRTYKVILSTLAQLGYDTEELVFDSYFFDAGPRARVFMLAYDRQSSPTSWQRNGEAISLYSCFSERIRN